MESQKAGILVTFDPLTESIADELPQFAQHNEEVRSTAEVAMESFKGQSEFITMPSSYERTPASIPISMTSGFKDNEMLRTQHDVARRAGVTVNFG